MSKKKETALVPVEQKSEQKSEQKAEQKSEHKMTIYEYEQRYVKRQSVRGSKFAVRFFSAVIGVFLFVVLALVALRVYDIHPYAGYATAAACVVVYICVFIVPLCKIMHAGYFVTNVNVFTAREAQKHNKKLRHDIADKIIDLTASVEGVGWYDSEVVGRLAIAVRTGNEDKIKSTLTELYSGSVKRSARDLIFKSALKSATYSAVSQAPIVDAALVVVVNLQLVKDLVFLYGFRPSDAKLVRIFGRVISNSLVAYGLGGLNVGSSVVKTMGDVVKGIPILGTAISTLVDSSVQGLTNGVLTTVIGYQTIKFLNQEYRLQDILDGIDLGETEAELGETCTELETELRKKKKFAPAV